MRERDIYIYICMVLNIYIEIHCERERDIYIYMHGLIYIYRDTL